jgi:hypothetical protein
MPKRRVQLFCDESGVDGDSAFTCVGMLYTTDLTRQILRATIGKIREEEGFWNEIHFVKFSTKRHRVYRRLIAETLPYVRYQAIVVHRDRMDIRYFRNQRWLALNYFTRLMVCGFLQPGVRAVLYLDDRTRDRRDNGLEYLLREVNRQRPGGLKTVESLDSKRSDLMQLSDLYLGLLRHGYVCGWPWAREERPIFDPDAGRKTVLYREFRQMAEFRKCVRQFRLWEWRPNERGAVP